MIASSKQKKNKKGKKLIRTESEIKEEQTRTLYIRLPHTIKNEKEVKDLFVGELKVKLPRQSSRSCHVIFPSVEDKVKNLEGLKKQLVDDKPVFACPPRPMKLDKKKKPKQKKIKIPEPVEKPNVGKYLFISKIEPGTKAPEIKSAFPGATTIALLKGLKFGKRQAKVKMSSSELCLHYANNKSEWPVIRGKKVEVRLAKIKKSKNKKTKSLKVYEGGDQKQDLDTTQDSEEQDEVSEGSDESEESDIPEDTDKTCETESEDEEDSEESKE